MTTSIQRVPSFWPNFNFSESRKIGNIHWHYQISRHTNPKAPTILLIHGTGSSAHSWYEIFTNLRKSYTMIAPDLLGHGFTEGATKSQLHIDRIAVELKLLLESIGLGSPLMIVGHSAGANCALILANLLAQQPKGIIGFNPSFVAPPSAYNVFLAPLINPIFTSSLMATLLSFSMPIAGMVDKLLNSTNSNLTELQKQYYRQLFKYPKHIYGSMNFMAASDIPQLLKRSALLKARMTYLLTADDPWVKKSDLLPIIQRYFPNAKLLIETGGHLFHEINPSSATAVIEQGILDILESF